jgi:DDE superfamily endonuclease
MPQLGSILLLMLLLMSEEEDGESSFRSQLELRFRRLRSGKIRRESLEYPNESAFAKLFRSRQDDALVTLCGFDHHSFQQLNTLFAPQYDGHSPYVFRGRLIVRHNKNKGGRRLLTSSQCLALVLAWTRTRGSMAVLQMIFGVTASSLSMWLRFGRRMLLLAIRTHPHAVVCLPTEDELQSFVDAVALKYPALVNCWGAMDGLKIRLEKAGNPRVQNLFYNGWTHDHYISNLFLFSPDGKIRACYVNSPGNMHDSTMAKWGGIYDKVDDLYRTHGVKIVVDSAFSLEGRDSVYKSYQNNIDNHGNVRQALNIQKQATSVRQLSEWGMRALQASFPRLKDRLIYEDRGERRLIMNLIVFLYNFRASVVGLNQIQSSFMPWLQRSANGHMPAA